MPHFCAHFSRVPAGPSPLAKHVTLARSSGLTAALPRGPHPTPRLRKLGQAGREGTEAAAATGSRQAELGFQPGTSGGRALDRVLRPTLGPPPRPRTRRADLSVSSPSTSRAPSSLPAPPPCRAAVPPCVLTAGRGSVCRPCAIRRGLPDKPPFLPPFPRLWTGLGHFIKTLWPTVKNKFTVFASLFHKVTATLCKMKEKSHAEESLLLFPKPADSPWL